MVEWHPRSIATPVEWTLTAPGGTEPLAVVRRLRFEGRTVFRAVTWAPTSGGRELIGYFPSGDDAALAVWRRHVRQQTVRHEAASRMHGSHERG